MSKYKLTLSIDEKLVKRLKIKAIERNITLSDLITSAAEEYTSIRADVPKTSTIPNENRAKKPKKFEERLKSIKTCKHGFMVGLCKHGCK